MNRIDELIHLYCDSGLRPIVDAGIPVYFENEDFSKFKFAPNVYRLRSMELHERKSGEPKFRITYGDTVPDWLSQELAGLPGAHQSPRVATNFNGDALVVAQALARILLKHR